MLVLRRRRDDGARSGGRRSPHVDTGPVDVPIDQATDEELKIFATGDALFELPLRDADGLGPLFTRTSCGACHATGLRGPGSVQKMTVILADGVTPSSDQSALPFGHTVHPLLAAGGKTAVLPPTDPAIKVKLTVRVGPPIISRGLRTMSRLTRFPAVFVATLLVAACSSSSGGEGPAPVVTPSGPTDAEQRTKAVQTMHDALLVDVTALAQAVSDLKDVAPTPADRGWDKTLDAAAIASMRAAWIRARTAYEHIEGALAPLFPDIDTSIDARYDDFLAELTAQGGDKYLFDEQGVIGMHAVERIIFSDIIPARVVTFEASLPGYLAAAMPATAQEAADFKNKLCAKLVADTKTLLAEWTPAKIDAAVAYTGLVSLVEEQREKVVKASTGEEESRYAQRTMTDLRDNLVGSKTVYAIFQPWLEAASVTAFRRLREELAQHGAPAELLEATRRAERDEVRHTLSMARPARRHGERYVRPRVADVAPRSLETIAHENAVEGCARETFGALLATWQATHVADVELARTLAMIAEDETRHAALSWEITRWSLSRLDFDACARMEAAWTAALDDMASGAGSFSSGVVGLPSPADARSSWRSCAASGPRLFRLPERACGRVLG